jgi:dihydropyrimidinase
MGKTYQYIIKGGMVVGPGGINRIDLGIKDGKIARLVSNLRSDDADIVIDGTEKYIFPGLFDVHVHPVYMDSIEDCSVLGAFGGITTMIHYAYAKPGTGLAETVRQLIEEGEEMSHTDFSIHGAMFDAKNQIADIPACFEMGVSTFKMFMTYAKMGWMTDDYHLAKAMDVISRVGGLAMVHGEDGLVIDYLEDKYKDRPEKEIFLKVRPGVLEADAVFRAISVAKVMDCPLYIVHVSSKEALEPIRWAREKGQTLYTETCPQYLCLTDKDLQEKGPLAKIGPPLRTDEDNKALWEALKMGLIDVIASDHAPKHKKSTDEFSSAPIGSPSSETILPVTYQRGVNEGRIDFNTLIRVLSEMPAKIFGLYPQKGVLQVGSDADLVVFDPKEKQTIRQATQHSNAPYSLYEGFECLGSPTIVMQRGEIIVKDGELKSQRGRGRFLPTRIH